MSLIDTGYYDNEWWQSDHRGHLVPTHLADELRLASELFAEKMGAVESYPYVNMRTLAIQYIERPDMAPPVCTICGENPGRLIMTDLAIGTSQTSCDEDIPILIAGLAQAFLNVDPEALLAIAGSNEVPDDDNPLPDGPSLPESSDADPGDDDDADDIPEDAALAETQ